MKDHYSWHEDLPYTYPHWLYDVLTALVYNLGGWNLIYVATCALSILLGFVIYKVNTSLNKNQVVSFVLTIGVMYLIKGYIAARAQLVTFILYMIVIFLIEEFLKNQVMDFSNYKERVEEKKKTFPYVPKIVKNQVYQDIIRLYLTNYKLDEAKQSLLIMQKEIGESDSIFNNVCDILQCRQSEEKYDKEYIPQISVKKMQSILKIANRDEQFRRYCLGKKGKRMIMSVEMLALMIEGERIDELEQIEKIYISYAGVMNLQSSLWQMEDRLARSTNYWIMQADNVELFAPSLIGICTWLDEHPEIDINPIELEAAQCIVFAEERREELE